MGENPDGNSILLLFKELSPTSRLVLELSTTPQPRKTKKIMLINFFGLIRQRKRGRVSSVPGSRPRRGCEVTSPITRLV